MNMGKNTWTQISKCEYRKFYGILFNYLYDLSLSFSIYPMIAHFIAHLILQINISFTRSHVLLCKVFVCKDKVFNAWTHNDTRWTWLYIYIYIFTHTHTHNLEWIWVTFKNKICVINIFYLLYFLSLLLKWVIETSSHLLISQQKPCDHWTIFRQRLNFLR